MTERIPESPPEIFPRVETVRPKWSVMIPAYNCLEFVAQAINGVLQQDPGEEFMQIEVVDDASTDGDLKALVLEVGKGRVGYFRQPENKGSLRNFETCLQRSKGYLIHLLHGDDVINDGYYKEMEKLFERFPEIGSAFCNNAFIDHEGKVTRRATTLLEEPGIIHDWQDKISVAVYCQPPAVTVRRDVYEKLGSFFGGHFGEDWEMWCRIAANYPVAYSPHCLAQYRTHSKNISTQYLFSGQSFLDIQKFIVITQSYLPRAKRKRLGGLTRQNFSTYFARQALKNFDHNRVRFIRVAFKAFLMKPNVRNTYLVSKLVAMYILRFKNKSS